MTDAMHNLTKPQTFSDQQRIAQHLRLSRRARTWGQPMTDIDSDGFRILDTVFIAYRYPRAIALIDYKTSQLYDIDRFDPNTHAMFDLAERAQLPAYVVWYADKGDQPWCWRFMVWRLTHRKGRTIHHTEQNMNERGYAMFLADLRRNADAD